MKKLVTALCAAAVVVCAWAQYATKTVGDTSLVESRVISRSFCKLHTIMGYNNSDAPVYVLIFESTTATNDQVAKFSFPVDATNYFALDFGNYGADLVACAVACSSTSTSNTLAGTNITVQAIISKVQ